MVGVTVLVFLLSVAVITVPLVYLFAYVYIAPLILLNPFLRGISLLPLLLLLCYSGIALFIYLVTNYCVVYCHRESIYGYWGLVLGEVIYTFPHALMILLRIIHV